MQYLITDDILQCPSGLLFPFTAFPVIISISIFVSVMMTSWKEGWSWMKLVWLISIKISIRPSTSTWSMSTIVVWWVMMVMIGLVMRRRRRVLLLVLHRMLVLLIRHVVTWECRISLQSFYWWHIITIVMRFGATNG